MVATLFRYSHGDESTLGLLFFDGMFRCYTLEDEHRTEKVYGETRIPPGEYRIRLRREGHFHQRYDKKFPFHVGMLELEGVPGFRHVLIHVGNRDDDTAGCILVGDQANNNHTTEGFVSYSTDAYKRVYPRMAAAANLDGDGLWLKIEEL